MDNASPHGPHILSAKLQSCFATVMPFAPSSPAAAVMVPGQLPSLLSVSKCCCHNITPVMSWTAGRRESGDGVPVTASSADPQVGGSNDPLALNYTSSTIEALNRNLGEARPLSDSAPSS